METIGRRIANIRKKRGFTQEKLAELANISIQFLSDIENDKKSMTITTVKNLAKCLNVSTDYIIFGKSNSEQSIQSMLSTLSSKEKEHAEKLLTVFIESIHDNTD